MARRGYVRLDDRARLIVAGAEARSFLQNLVTNDMEKAAPDRAIYAALLTPQGKYLHDFFVVEWADGFWLETEAARAADLVRRLATYRLRGKVTIEPAADGRMEFAMFGDDAAQSVGLAAEPGAARPFAGGIAFVDPRLAAAGVRAVLPAETAEAALIATGAAGAARAEYETHRLRLGLPEGTRDFIVDKTLPLEFGADDLNGIDFAKGCYVGQEVTTRMKHRALVRKRLVPVTIEGTTPACGAAIMLGELEVGEMRSAQDGAGLALLKLEHLEFDGATLRAGAARLRPCRPDWAKF